MIVEMQSSDGYAYRLVTEALASQTYPNKGALDTSSFSRGYLFYRYAGGAGAPFNIRLDGYSRQGPTADAVLIGGDEITVDPANVATYEGALDVRVGHITKGFAAMMAFMPAGLKVRVWTTDALPLQGTLTMHLEFGRF